MENETKLETYTFTHSNEDGVLTSLNFTVPAVGVTISTFHSMCRKFAYALGYAEASINEWFGDDGDESFIEFME